jgi:threonine dehydrogenase-like Zn-dependent dehydrogenase
MKAAIFKGMGTVEIEERPKPEIQEGTDIVVRVVPLDTPFQAEVPRPWK